MSRCLIIGGYTALCRSNIDPTRAHACPELYSGTIFEMPIKSSVLYGDPDLTGTTSSEVSPSIDVYHDHQESAQHEK